MMCMDKFVVFKRKGEPEPEYIGNQSVFETIKKIVDSNDTVCLYGESGVGKTHLVRDIMRGRNWVDFTYETVKTLDRLQESDCHIVIDDLVDSIKDILEQVKSGKRLSRGSLIFIARTPNKIDFCNSVHFEKMDEPTMVYIGRTEYPTEPVKRLESLAKESRGNIRNFLFSITFTCHRDIFKTPKDFITDLLCDHSTEDPRKYLGDGISEHGYIWDIVHENYVDSTKVKLEEIAELMSLSDILDTKIYNGNWELIPLFSTLSTVAPAIAIDHSLKKSSMRSGSAWTKYGNYKMRILKYKSIINRTHKHVDIDSLMVMRDLWQADKQRGLEVMREYGIRGPDIDVINHLAVVKKLKAKEIQTIKKSLAAPVSS